VVQGALTFRGPADAEAVAGIVDEIAADHTRRLAIAVPSTATWSLPAYELAIMAAVELRSRGVDSPAICVVTPERQPLEVFGPLAAQAVARLLAERGIRLHTGCTPRALEAGALSTEHGRKLEADVVIALPEALGPYLAGLPQDPRGFIPADAHGRVTGSPDVYAAGDVTTFPLRQGGLAAQQADAAAESIAARMGAISRTRPFRPVLRGILLTGGAPLYLRATVGSAEAPVARPLRGVRLSEAGHRALWWPPTKVAGRYIAPLLATARLVPLTASPMRDIGYAEPEEGGDGDALGLALALADEDAACGDYDQALHALDAARALSGGVLPDDYEAKQREWLRRV
jgi:sulfide:quinone oxidoreductase